MPETLKHSSVKYMKKRKRKHIRCRVTAIKSGLHNTRTFNVTMTCLCCNYTSVSAAIVYPITVLSVSDQAPQTCLAVVL